MAEPNSGTSRTLYIVVGALVILVVIGAVTYFGGVNQTATEPAATMPENSTTVVPAPAPEPAPAAPAENTTGTTNSTNTQ